MNKTNNYDKIKLQNLSYKDFKLELKKTKDEYLEERQKRLKDDDEWFKIKEKMFKCKYLKIRKTINGDADTDAYFEIKLKQYQDYYLELKQNMIKEKDEHFEKIQKEFKDAYFEANNKN